jgi:hypothetical protein
MQLAAETEFFAWRLEVGAVARGRKPQSLQDFLCAPAAHVPDMSGRFMETENHAIPVSCVVELSGGSLEGWESPGIIESLGFPRCFVVRSWGTNWGRKRATTTMRHRQADTRYLELHRGKYRVTLATPRPLHGQLALLWQIRLTGVAEEFFTVRAPQGRRPCEEVEDGLPYGGHARLWRRSPDCFFSVPRL